MTCIAIGLTGVNYKIYDIIYLSSHVPYSKCNMVWITKKGRSCGGGFDKKVRYCREVNGRRAWTGAIKSKTTGRRRYLKVRTNGGGWRFWMPIVDERSRRTEKGKMR